MADWEKDLYAISDFCDGSVCGRGDTDEAKPKNSNKTTTRKFPISIYDDSDLEDDEDPNQEIKPSDPFDINSSENQQYTFGRGYCIQNKLKLKSVGRSFLDFQSDTTKSIRSVSNIDYSNDTIEKTFGRHRKILNEKQCNGVDVTKEKTSSYPPLSELLKNCKRTKKLGSKLCNIVQSTSNENPVKEPNLQMGRSTGSLDLSSELDFPSLT